MVDLTARTDRTEGVTLVRARLRHDGADPRRVCVESELDPVWPPRQEGVPAAGWDRRAGALTVRIDPGERIGIGFASPARPVDPPVTVAAVDRADRDRPRMPTPAAVVRTLGDPSPPAAAVPGPEDRGDRERSGARSASPETGQADEGDRSGRSDTGERDPAVDPESPESPDPTDLPAVTAWLAAVEERLAAVERSAPTDRDRRRLERDAERLRRVADRTTGLARRADRLRRQEDR